MSRHDLGWLLTALALCLALLALLEPAWARVFVGFVTALVGIYLGMVLEAMPTDRKDDPR